jgi:hypothetical protein
MDIKGLHSVEVKSCLHVMLKHVQWYVIQTRRMGGVEKKNLCHVPHIE